MGDFSSQLSSKMSNFFDRKLSNNSALALTPMSKYGGDSHKASMTIEDNPNRGRYNKRAL
jgi:hypothetical protein